MPEDLGKTRIEPSGDDIEVSNRLQSILYHDGHEAYSEEDSVSTKTVIDAIVSIGREDLSKRRAARGKLMRMWRAGLITRIGLIHGNSGRPYRQSWFFPHRALQWPRIA
jgi:hypothetical protein